MGRTKGDPPIFVRPARAGFPAALSVSYEELLMASNEKEAASQLVQQLQMAGYPVQTLKTLVPYPPVDVARMVANNEHSTSKYTRQDRSSRLSDKISNYAQLREFYHRNFTNLFCIIMMRRQSCDNNSMYALPP